MSAPTAIPTVYRSVQMKSRLESKVAYLLDLMGWKWEYEPFSVIHDGLHTRKETDALLPDRWAELIWSPGMAEQGPQWR